VGRHRFHVVLANGGEGDVAVVHDGDFGAIRGMDGIGVRAPDLDALDVGDALEAKTREILVGHDSSVFYDVHGPMTWLFHHCATLPRGA